MKPGTILDFETLVELYYQPVFTLAVKLCGKLDRALELTQHTFCLALNRQAYLGETHRAKGWLLTLLFREFLKDRRFKKDPGTVEYRLKQGAATQFVGALKKVREELRAPLILFYAKDFSWSQIADYLGISMEEVLTLLSKGREEMSLAVTPSVSRGRQPFAAPAERGRRVEMLPLAA